MKQFVKGLFEENPVFVLMLGLCPVLAVSTSCVNALGMGAAATFVLVCSNLIISLVRKCFPARIRIPCFILVIATFVVIVERVLAAYQPELSRQLGIFIPLIVVNCIILGRAEAFASKNSVGRSVADGLGMGIGFTGALLLIAFIREALGSGKIIGVEITPGFEPMALMILPPGAFLTIGFLLALFRLRKSSDNGC
jgi:electron transport complex protein RnfE